MTLAEEFMPEEADADRRLEALNQSLRNPDYELLVAEIEGEIIGFLDHWVIHDFAHGANLSYIQNLYVTPQHRRKGIGSKLLGQIIKKAEAKGVMEVHVATEFGNKPAVELYRKQGFLKEHLQLEMEL